MPHGLVPEKRLDKNGRLVTRHVKPASAADARLVIPSPALEGKKHHDELVREAVSYVDDILQWHEHKQIMRMHEKACREAFPELQDDTLEKIADYGRSAEYDMDAVYEYTCITTLAHLKADDVHYRHFMLMDEEMQMSFEIADSETAIALTLALKTYDRLLDLRPAVPPRMEDRAKYYRALIGVTLSLEEVLEYEEVADRYEYDEDDPVSPPIFYTEVIDSPDTPPSPVIDNEKIFELVIDHVDRADELMRFIEERKETEAEPMEAYLKDHPSAIAEGSL